MYEYTRIIVIYLRTYFYTYIYVYIYTYLYIYACNSAHTVSVIVHGSCVREFVCLCLCLCVCACARMCLDVCVSGSNDR